MRCNVHHLGWPQEQGQQNRLTYVRRGSQRLNHHWCFIWFPLNLDCVSSSSLLFKNYLIIYMLWPLIYTAVGFGEQVCWKKALTVCKGVLRPVGSTNSDGRCGRAAASSAYPPANSWLYTINAWPMELYLDSSGVHSVFKARKKLRRPEIKIPAVHPQLWFSPHDGTTHLPGLLSSLDEVLFWIWQWFYEHRTVRSYGSCILICSRV